MYIHDFLSFLIDLKIQKGQQEANDNGIKSQLKTKKYPMGDPKGQVATDISCCYRLKKGRNYPLNDLCFFEASMPDR
jgi:hypothetical protein